MEGTNRGIGYEITRILLESPGNHVLLGCRNRSLGETAADALRSLPETQGTVEPIEVDVVSNASVDEAVAAIATQHGRIDNLVNNAGVFRRGEPRVIAHEIFSTNVIGAISVTEACLPLLRASVAAGGTPRLIFVSSSTGSLTYVSDPSSKYHTAAANEYRAANAARNMLVIQYWLKLQNDGILVFGADPGLTATSFVGSPDALRQRGAGRTRSRWGEDCSCHQR